MTGSSSPGDFVSGTFGVAVRGVCAISTRKTPGGGLACRYLRDGTSWNPSGTVPRESGSPDGMG